MLKRTNIYSPLRVSEFEKIILSLCLCILFLNPFPCIGVENLSKILSSDRRIQPAILKLNAKLQRFWLTRKKKTIMNSKAHPVVVTYYLGPEGLVHYAKIKQRTESLSDNKKLLGFVKELSVSQKLSGNNQVLYEFSTTFSGHNVQTELLNQYIMGDSLPEGASSEDKIKMFNLK